jgi:hypothetical protein
MTKKSIQCSVVGSGRHWFNGVTGSEVLGKMIVLWAWGRRESTVTRARVHSAMGSGRMTLLQAREWHHGLGDGACVVDDITDSGQCRWRHVKGLDHGQEGRHGCSEEYSMTARRLRGGDSMMVQRLRGGLDDGMGSGEDSTMAQALGRSTMARAPMKFSVGNFGCLTA